MCCAKHDESHYAAQTAADQAIHGRKERGVLRTRATEDTVARRVRSSLSRMPPEERFLPRFAAEPPQEALPYGRWADRLSAELLGACLALSGDSEDLGEPGEIVWYPDRTWHGRTYVPA